jgi:hypothetical protein
VPLVLWANRQSCGNPWLSGHVGPFSPQGARASDAGIGEGPKARRRKEREQLQHQGQRRRTEPALSEAEGSVRPTRARNSSILKVALWDSSRTDCQRLSAYIGIRAVPFGTLSCFQSFPGTSVPGYFMPPLTGLGRVGIHLGRC